MYGFGEVKNADKETLQLMEEYVIEFLINTCKRADERSKRSGYTQVQLKDLIHIMQQDPVKY